MQRLTSITFMLLLLLVAQSCFQKSSKVSLKLTSSFAFGGANMTGYSQGGLMVWGQSSTGKSFGRVLAASDDVTLELENGTWSFYAMAWQNGSFQQLNAVTAVRCAALTGQALSGDSKLDLSLTQAQCALPIFAGNLSTLAGSTVMVKACESIATTTLASDLCTNDRADVNHKSDRAPVTSVRFTLEEYTNGVPSGAGLSRCVGISTASPSGTWATPAGGVLVIPAGDASGANPFRLKTELFLSSSTCDDPAGTQTLTYVTQGLAQTVANRRYLNNGPGQQMLFFQVTDSDLCGGGRASLEPFAAGVGGTGAPYVICSAKQLLNTLSHVNKYFNSYLLAADIDMNRHSNGLENADNLVTNFSDIINNTTYPCWELGQNFQPIGSDFSGCGTYLTSAYTGNFDGNYHRIENLRMRVKNGIGVGLIGQWQPSAGGYLRDLTFVNPEIEGQQMVGTLFGNKPNADLGLVYDVNVKDMSLRAGIGGMAGGLIGYGQNLELYRVSTSGRLSGEGSRLGGVAGNLNNMIQMNRVRSISMVDTMRTGSAVERVGGLVGEFVMSSGAALNNLSHEGTIYTHGTKVGGLFGSLSKNVALEDFYANTAIYTQNSSNHEVGGITGLLTNNMNANRGYFSGHIIDECTSGCGRNYFSSHTAGTLTNFYYVYNPAFFESFALQGVARTNDASGFYLSGNLTNLNLGSWVHNADALPRLLWENHPCALPANTATFATQLGRGTPANPYHVCTAVQWSEFSAIASGFASETVFKVMTPINVVGAGMGGVLWTNTHLTGDKFGLLFGFTSLDGAADAPFEENSGKITNLTFANTFVQLSTSRMPKGLVSENHGLIENVRLRSAYLKATAFSAAGVMFYNHPTGKVRNVDAHINLTANGNAYGFVKDNFGTSLSVRGEIEDVRLTGMINTIGTNNIFGFVGINDGLISKVSQGINLETGTAHPEVHKFAGDNSGLGELRDIHIESHSRWQFRVSPGGYASTVAKNNTGKILRVLDQGEFVDTNTGSLATSSLQMKPLITGILTAPDVEGVISVPSGRKITEVPIGSTTCGTGVLSMTLPSAPFDASYFDASPLTGKTVWVRLRGSDDRYFFFEVSTFTAAGPLNLTLPELDLTQHCNQSSYVALIQGFNTTPALSAPNFSQSSYNSYDPLLFTSGDWGGVDVLDTSDPGGNIAPLRRMLGLFSHFMGVQVLTSEPPLPVWEYEGDRIQIFRINKDD